jgi:hypothetical protein
VIIVRREHRGYLTIVPAPSAEEKAHDRAWRPHSWLELTRQDVGADLAILTDLKDAVEHVVPRILRLSSEKVKYLVHEPQGARSANRREDNEARMHIRAADEPTEVASILGDQDAILFDASFEDGMVELSAPSDIKRMKCIESKPIEAAGERRG